MRKARPGMTLEITRVTCLRQDRELGRIVVDPRGEQLRVAVVAMDPFPAGWPPKGTRAGRKKPQRRV
jgi:hypothetical protein